MIDHIESRGYMLVLYDIHRDTPSNSACVNMLKRSHFNAPTTIHPGGSTSSGLGNMVALQGRPMHRAAPFRRREIERRAVI
jgi:hypothetical protein